MKKTIQVVIVHLLFSIWVLTSVHFSLHLFAGFLSENLFKTTVDGVVIIGFRYGFLAASIGMIIGQIVFTTYYQIASLVTSVKTNSSI